ncbi:hypothetical protein WT71_12730 [Burkholderia stagnalis]|nr:hypothetical protein WT71_12730 [Burkholderia stagnalis]KWI80337.1 hypothetical protein WT73_28725 [Burkholderia stagnalis]
MAGVAQPFDAVGFDVGGIALAALRRRALARARAIGIAFEFRVARFGRVLVERRIDVERVRFAPAASLPLSDESPGPSARPSRPRRAFSSSGP